MSYTLGKSRGNTSGQCIPVSSFQLLDDMNLELNEGPTDVDRRHNLVFSGAAIVPKTGGLTSGPSCAPCPGSAFTIQDTNMDPDRNGILFEPLPAGTYSGTGSTRHHGRERGGRNGARARASSRGHAARLSFKLRGASRVELFAEFFNLTNRANFDNPTGDRRSTNFLAHGAPRGRRAAHGPVRRALRLLEPRVVPGGAALSHPGTFSPWRLLRGPPDVR